MNLLANFTRRGQQAIQAQAIYLNALTAHNTGKVEIIKGYHSFRSRYLPAYQRLPNESTRVKVWKVEKKFQFKTWPKTSITPVKQAIIAGGLR